MNPPEHALVLAVDEKSQIQALDRTAPCLPILPTTPARMTHDLAVLRKALAHRGMTEEALARSLGVMTDDPERPRWPKILREQVREQLIFASDSETYRTAKRASDGLEHGFLELDAIAAHALKWLFELNRDEVTVRLRNVAGSLLLTSPGEWSRRFWAVARLCPMTRIPAVLRGRG